MAPIGPSHFYIISKQIASEQKIALDLLKTYPLVHTVSYESLLQDLESQMQLLDQFIGECGSNTNSYCAVQLVISCLLKSISRGNGFKAVQMSKWEPYYEKDGVELEMVESACWEIMEELQYFHFTDRKMEYTKEEIEDFKDEDKREREEKNIALKEEDFEDWRRREKLKAILTQASKYKATEDVSESLKVNPNSSQATPSAMDWKKSFTVNCNETLRNIGRDLKHELWPPRFLTMWMFIAGFMSGFLVGLISVGGPPLIIFFFFYDYPEVQTKANGVVITAVNTLVRMITYISRTPPPEYGHGSWFVKEDIWLYVTVAVVGLVAAPIGIHMAGYLNKGAYKAGLALLLIINGVTMVVTSIIKMTEQSQ
jgi:hypothetical protein